MPLNDKIKAARLDAQKTQEQVASHIGVTKGAVSQWETGETVPDLEYFREFCLYTGVSADALLLDRSMSDPLLSRLVNIWHQLTPEGKDKLIGAANRVLVEEQTQPREPSKPPKKPIPRIKRPPFS
jgi:transcriptional regulator with XRE-family HTH domain